MLQQIALGLRARHRWSLIIAALLSVIDRGSALICYCTAKYCQQELCEGPWCLIGMKENEGIVKACGTEVSTNLRPCRQRVGAWSEICSCNDYNFCNSFKNFRNAQQYPPPGHSSAFGSGSSYRYGQQRSAIGQSFDPADPLSYSGSYASAKARQQQLNVEIITDNGILRDPGPSSSSNNDEQDFDHLIYGDKSAKTDILVLVVVLPLCLGAVAVCVVVFNYYCKLC